MSNIINLSGLLNQDSQNYLNLHNALHPTTGPQNQNPINHDVALDTVSSGGKADAKDDHLGDLIIDADDGRVGMEYYNKINVNVVSGKPAGTLRFSIYDEMTGLPPPGITLNPDGSLTGIPTKAGSYDFQACVMDDEQDGDCFYIRLFVAAKVEKITPSPLHKCPINSCDTGTCCCVVNDGIRTSGVLTWEDCGRCPNDAHEVGKDVITSGGPYRICDCNKC